MVNNMNRMCISECHRGTPIRARPADGARPEIYPVCSHDQMPGNIARRSPLMKTIRQAEAELEIMTAHSKPAKKPPPQKCGNCAGEGLAARSCIKGQANVRSDTLPQTTTV